VITVDTSALKVVNRRFEQMKERAKYPKTAMDVIGAKAWKDVLNSFNVETDEDGSPWKPLKKERSGKRHKGGSKLLRDTGQLRTSIRWAANNEEARVFTKKKYAKFHEYGTKYIPIRSFMWINSKLRVKFLTDLLSYIKG
jgi:phage virion morphogenesis protein